MLPVIRPQCPWEVSLKQKKYFRTLECSSFRKTETKKKGQNNRRVANISYCLWKKKKYYVLRVSVVYITDLHHFLFLPRVDKRLT